MTSLGLLLFDSILATMASPEKTTYVSSSGQLTSAPLTRRIADAASDLAEVGWLFFDTLFTVSRAHLQSCSSMPHPTSIWDSTVI